MDSLTTFLLLNEPMVRITAFAVVLAAMVAWEAVTPRRPLGLGRRRRWPANLGIVVLNTVLLRLALPLVPVSAALFAAHRGWGLLNHLVLPDAVAVVCGVLLLDLLIWTQHVVFHKVPLLWRLHRMHHADQDIDVTTGARFHPVEILLSAAIKLAAVVTLGVPAVAVLLFEVLLNATAMFNHANVALPPRLDAVLRLLVVTPDMHRVHHSWHRDETDSNYGFNFPWWDRLFGTYRAQPRGGHDGMTIGLKTFRSAEDQRLWPMLTQPLRRESPRAGTLPAAEREI